MPALLDLLRHKTPSVRIRALWIMIGLEGAMAMKGLAILQDDLAEVHIVQDTGSFKTQVRHFASMSPEVAILYARWHPVTRAVDDFNERQMIQAAREACRAEVLTESLQLPRFISRDAWNRPIRVDLYPTANRGVFVWSAGPNGEAGDQDDIVRYLRNCPPSDRDPKGLIWTAAGGGATASPSEMEAFCN